MNRSKLLLILSIVLLLVLTLVILPGCKTTVATETTAGAASTTIAAATTASETTAAPTETTSAASLYTYENLRKMADAGKYEGTPAKGHNIAFANIIEGIDFSSQVREPISRNWLAAGGAEGDLALYDNNWDSATAIKVADLAIAAKPEVFIEFQIDGNVNEIIGRKARDAGVFIIAVDIPVTGFPFMGVDNYGAATLAGKYAIDQIEKGGGIDKIDKVFVAYDVSLGDYVNQRAYGIKNALIEKYGDIVDPTKDGSKLIMLDQKNTTESMQKAVAEQLSKYPNAKNFVITTQNDIGMAGAIAAAEVAGRWDPEKWICVSVNCEKIGQQMLREGKIDGDVAFFPEKYGNYLVPAAIAHIYNNPIPAYILMDHVVITKENVDQYYPIK